jgi:hypothetical protein
MESDSDCSEAAVLHFLLDEMTQPADGLFLGGFAIFPERPQVISPFSVGDVLVVSPEPIEPAAELVNEVMIVIAAAGGFANVFKLVFCDKRHREGAPKG